MIRGWWGSNSRTFCFVPAAAITCHCEERSDETIPSLKLCDYDATPTIRTYVLISQDEQRAMVYSRDADGRLGIQSAVLLEGDGASIEIPEFGLSLLFSALYEGLDFPPDRVPIP
jgi:Uma2 family endonuclease